MEQIDAENVKLNRDVRNNHMNHALAVVDARKEQAKEVRKNEISDLREQVRQEQKEIEVKKGVIKDKFDGSRSFHTNYKQMK